MYMYMYIYANMCVYVYICTSIYICTHLIDTADTWHTLCKDCENMTDERQMKKK